MIARYSRPEMAALWSEDARFSLWLEVETVALEALVREGLAPKVALEEVRKKATVKVDRIHELERTLKHDVIAFLTSLSESVGDAARYLHLGMTSSDLVDTAFSVQLCRATDLILRGLDALLESVRGRALEFQHVPCVGRTHGIHAEPVTFGLKLANWHAELSRQRARLEAAREGVAVGAISGPVGTFAYLPPAVEVFVCEKLGLAPDPVSTQIIQRDRHAALFCAFAGAAGTLERICLEVRHLQRTEVREAEEYFATGQKGSSSMPHKRNPILSENVTGLARLIRSYAQAALENMALWHERDISHSSVERVIAPDATIALDFMIDRVRGIVDGLVVSPSRMGENLELTGGLIFSGGLLVALTSAGLSREAAYSVVQRHALAAWDNMGSGGESFSARVRNDPEVMAHLPPAALEEVFSLDRYLAHVDFIFARVFGDQP